MDLFDEPARDIALGEGAARLGGFARQLEAKLLAAVDAIVKVSPLRHMTTPGGHRMSVAMTNCGGLGWVTDPAGYRYDSMDPETSRAWRCDGVSKRCFHHPRAGASGRQHWP